MFGVGKFPVCVCVKQSFPGSGNGPRVVLFDLGTESEILPCVLERGKERSLTSVFCQCYTILSPQAPFCFSSV